jgi:hypothetical protein
MDWSDPFTICGTDAEREDNDNIDQRRHVTWHSQIRKQKGFVVDTSQSLLHNFFFFLV